jgi:hypothetical protein
MAAIRQMHADHPQDLPAALEQDAALRTSFVQAHETLMVPVREFPTGDSERQQIFDFCLEMATQHPDFYAKVHPFDYDLYPTAAWLRERFWITWQDALNLTADRKAQIAAAGQLTGRYADLFDKWDVLVLDNMGLDADQLDHLYELLALIPADLHDLHSISVRDFLGTPPIPISLDGRPDWDRVNIFGVKIPDAIENSFPDDVSPGNMPVFCGAASHEVNHVVNHFTIEQNSTLNARQAALISAAGRDPVNYLRSMFNEGFFVDAPQEFFASISNEWFTDSVKTLELGLVRFDAGRQDPINQALFFADVYSQGGDSTFFYKTDLQGTIDRQTVPLHRDDQGRIDRILLGTHWYAFTLDAAGDVTAYTVTDIVPNVSFAGTGDFNGDKVADLLWRRDNGSVFAWLVQTDGTHAVKEIGQTPDPAMWTIVGIGDFNSDGSADILWRHKASGLGRGAMFSPSTGGTPGDADSARR